MVHLANQEPGFPSIVAWEAGLDQRCFALLQSTSDFPLPALQHFFTLAGAISLGCLHKMLPSYIRPLVHQ